MLPKIIILLLILIVLLTFERQQDVLGTRVTQRPTLQIDWFRPLLRSSNRPVSNPPAQVPSPSNSQSTQPLMSPISSPSSPPSNNCLDSGDAPLPVDPITRLPTCECIHPVLRCQNGHCVEGEQCDPARNPTGWLNTGPDHWCHRGPTNNLVPVPDGWYCNAKPVIYLYPKEKTLVDVKVTMQEGKVVISDPLYDNAFKGWDDVLAYPDGTLFLKGQRYHELFYETVVKGVVAPKNGLIIPREKLEENLRRITTSLGLNSFEQQEFLDYWLPELKSLNSRYILFSLLDDGTKKRIDDVEITPKPDTFIYLAAYFKPLQELIEIESLILPVTPPERVGFTAVEWGGTVEY